MLIKFKVTVSGDEFSYEGDGAIADLLPSLLQWLTLQTNGHRGQALRIQALTERLMRTTDSLAVVVQRHETDFPQP